MASFLGKCFHHEHLTFTDKTFTQTHKQSFVPSLYKYILRALYQVDA